MTFTYNVDSPRAGELIQSPWVLLRGWVVSDVNASLAVPTLTDAAGAHRLPLAVVDRPDVRAAYPSRPCLGFNGCFALGDLPPGDAWFVQFRHGAEVARFPVTLPIDRARHRDFEARKLRKLEGIRPLLRCPACQSADVFAAAHDQAPVCSDCSARYRFTGKAYDFLTPTLLSRGEMPPSTDNVSQWGYNEEMLELIHAHRNGWVLDAGAGLKTVYYDNVVNLEIVDYPTTDVLSLGECLPFKTDVFDAALSVAVLEHVRDPFAYARELIRVLKPGGTLLAVAPFLQPLHGYPDHFYNMTSSGLRNLFEGPLIIEATRVAGHPIAALTWFLGAYLRGLPAPTAAAFERLSVAELVCNAEMLHAESFVRDLTPAACEELACANAIVARKPRA